MEKSAAGHLEVISMLERHLVAARSVRNIQRRRLCPSAHVDNRGHQSHLVLFRHKAGTPEQLLQTLAWALCKRPFNKQCQSFIDAEAASPACKLLAR